MADKVEFRQGNKELLPTQNFQPGSFYLTTDSHELYFAKNAENLIYIGSPYHVGEKAPDNLHQLWIHINNKKGGLKYYNGTEWIHVPVAFTAMPNETPTEPDEENPEIPTEQPNYDDFDMSKAIRIDAISSGTTWDAPEDGWYKVEAFGASGGGAAGYSYEYSIDDDNAIIFWGTGSGGGGGGYACSVVQLKAKDRIIIAGGQVEGNDLLISINSSYDTYKQIKVTCGKSDSYPTRDDWVREGGLGGEGSGGNVTELNLRGAQGEQNSHDTWEDMSDIKECNFSGGQGGAPAHEDGNAGGNGSNIVKGLSSHDHESGKPGFVRITKY